MCHGWCAGAALQILSQKYHAGGAGSATPAVARCGKLLRAAVKQDTYGITPPPPREREGGGGVHCRDAVVHVGRPTQCEGFLRCDPVDARVRGDPRKHTRGACMWRTGVHGRGSSLPQAADLHGWQAIPQGFISQTSRKMRDLQQHSVSRGALPDWHLQRYVLFHCFSVPLLCVCVCCGLVPCGEGPALSVDSGVRGSA